MTRSKATKVLKEAKEPEFKPIQFIARISELKGLFKKLSIAMGSEQTRYYLMSVLFEKRGDEINFVATDGHKAAIINAKENSDFALGKKLDSEGDFAFVIPRAAIDELLKHAKLNASTVAIAINKKTISFTYGVNDCVKTYKLLNATYPEWRAAVPAEFKPYACFNPRYLKQIAGVLGGDVVLQSAGAHSSEPTVISNGAGCKFVIMPRRL